MTSEDKIAENERKISEIEELVRERDERLHELEGEVSKSEILKLNAIRNAEELEARIVELETENNVFYKRESSLELEMNELKREVGFLFKFKFQIQISNSNSISNFKFKFQIQILLALILPASFSISQF